MKELVELKNLSKTYTVRGKKVLALKEINLVVNKGEIVSVVGPSGCGKTTLLKLIANIYTHYSGSIHYSEYPVSEARKKGLMSYIAQEPALLPSRTVKQNIFLPQELKKIEDQNRIREVIDLVGLNGYESYYPYQLSGGLKQRVSIARALVLNPQVILMDEPFSSLDEFTREELNVQLLKIQKKFRQTIIFITHNLEEAVFLSRRVIILTKTPGSILAEVNIDLPYNRSLGLKSKPEFYKHIIEVREKMRAGC